MSRSLSVDSVFSVPTRPVAASRVPSEGSRMLAGMLLSAVLAALLVVADQLIETWADGHLLLVWVGLWTVAFTALALLAPPLRKLTGALARGLARWSRHLKQQREEAAFWAAVESDPRMLDELRIARWHAEP